MVAPDPATRGIVPEPAEVDAVLARGLMLFPAVEPGSGPFAGRTARWSVPDAVLSEAELTAAASLYLALMTGVCLEMIGAAGPTLVEGPFAANALFMEMLATVTGRAVAAAATATGTSAGAALLALADAPVSHPRRAHPRTAAGPPRRARRLRRRAGGRRWNPAGRWVKHTDRCRAPPPPRSSCRWPTPAASGCTPSASTPPRPSAPAPAATQAAVEHLGYVQIDTINVIERSHHHILWTRIPDYRRADLHQALSVDKTVFEYWTHALAYVPTREFRFFLADMRGEIRPKTWFRNVAPEEVRRVVARVRREGALSIRDIDDDELVDKDHPWASRKPSKRALQLAFFDGLLTISARAGMVKTYELTGRHFGWAKPPRPATERQRLDYFLDRALRAQGVVSLDSIQQLGTATRRAAIAAGDRRPRRAPPPAAGDGRRRPALDRAGGGRARRGAAGRPRPHPLAVRPAGDPARPPRSSSSATITASRPMSRRRSASSATSRCRSSSATASSPRSTSRPTARGASS